MTRHALTRGLLVAAAVLLAAGPGRAAKAEPAAPAPELFVKDGTAFRPATAAEKGATSAHAAHPEESKTSFIDINRYDLGIYTLVVFGLLYLFVQFLVWPKVAEGLKKREAAIQGARDDARADRQAAEQRLADAKRQLDETAEKVRVMFEDARKQADATIARANDEAAQKIAAGKAEAVKAIGIEREAARQELYQQAVELASLLSAKTIRRQLSADDHRRLLDESLSELQAGVRH